MRLNLIQRENHLSRQKAADYDERVNRMESEIASRDREISALKENLKKVHESSELLELTSLVRGGSLNRPDSELCNLEK